ncbi:MAG: potassium channel family protein [Bacteroidales bacterium]|nr:potassium channel family protein [Bacteroidales bacterium]
MIKAKERALIFTFILILIVIIAGVIGYMVIEDLSFIDALYMTVITVSTVGFKEVHEFSDGGRIFTIFLIIISIGLIGYSFTRITTFFIENKLRHLIIGVTTKTGKNSKQILLVINRLMEIIL